MTARPHFHAGRNTPGYLPDGDGEPAVYLTWNDAKASVIDDLKFLEDHAVDETEAESACHAAEDVNLWAESDLLEEWNVKVNDGTAHGLGTVFWLYSCDEGYCDLSEWVCGARVDISDEGADPTCVKLIGHTETCDDRV